MSQFQIVEVPGVIFARHLSAADLVESGSFMTEVLAALERGCEEGEIPRLVIEFPPPLDLTSSNIQAWQPLLHQLRDRKLFAILVNASDRTKTTVNKMGLTRLIRFIASQDLVNKNLPEDLDVPVQAPTPSPNKSKEAKKGA